MNRNLSFILAGLALPLALTAQSSVPMGTIRAAPPAAAPVSSAAPPALLVPGTVAPDFLMHDLAGNEVRLTDYAGQVVILDFWAPWCGPCLASFPHTQQLAAKYREQGVVVLASGTSDTIENFQRWIAANEAKYPDMKFAWDLHERGSATFEQRASAHLFGVTGLPTLFVIGRDGKVVNAIVGNGGADDARVETSLAEAGLDVPAEIVARGQEQLAAAARRAAERELAAAEAERNPPPPFHENFGQLRAGDAVPEFALENAAGEPVSFGALAEGRTVVMGFWSTRHGPPAPMLQQWNAWQERYQDEVLFLGVGIMGTAADLAAWQAEQTEVAITVLNDPAGAMPRASGSLDELSAEDRADFLRRQSEFIRSTVPQRIAGIMPMVPAVVVINAEGKLLGSSAGWGPRHAHAVGNLLLRAGIELAAEDRPARVYTPTETAPPPPDPRVERLAIGAMAPDFTTLDLEGREVKISDFRGRVLVLDFWATWCGPCMTAMPHTQNVAADYQDQGVVVLGSATSDGRANFERWVRANQDKYPDMIWAHDPAERTPERASLALYGVTGIPTQFVIDREGRVVDIVVGYRPGEVILDAALAKAGIVVDAAVLKQAQADLDRRAADAAATRPGSAALPLMRPRG